MANERDQTDLGFQQMQQLFLRTDYATDATFYRDSPRDLVIHFPCQFSKLRNFDNFFGPRNEILQPKNRN
jgi:hypothetical protein